MKRFGGYLVDEGLISECDLRRALGHQYWLRRRRIGDILVAMGKVKRSTLDEVFVTQMRQREERLPLGCAPFGQFLLAEGLIDEVALDEALRRQRTMRAMRIGEVLVDIGCLSRADLEKAVRAQLSEFAVA